jgi:hypothetical protein
MLRIFRGERHVEGAAQPGQQAQDATPGADTDVAAQNVTTPPPSTGNGHSEQGARDLGPAASAAAQEGSAPTQAQRQTDAAQSAEEPGAQEPTAQEPGFLDRGRMRRRARFLRAARELAYRDLGGLVFDLHRFGGRNDEVVAAKLETLSRIDSELRILEATLRERMPVTVLREAGVAACPRCAAIHGSGDRFCPACGLAVDQSERPIAGSNVPAPPPPPSPGVAWQPPSAAWRPPSSPPSTAAPLIPDPSRPPIPGTPAAPIPDTSPAPEPPTSSGDANPSPPTAPPSVRSQGEPPESQTEVIRSNARRRPRQQRTIAFDPLSPPTPTASPPTPKADPDRAEGEHGQERP